MITPNEFKALRIEKGLTQSELAKRVGTTQTTITNIEKGITQSPSVDIALKIAIELNTDIYTLFGDNNVKKISKKETDIEISKLKYLVFKALEDCRGNAQYFYITDLMNHKETAELTEDQTKDVSIKLETIISFSKDIIKTLLNMEFWSLEELNNFKFKKDFSDHEEHYNPENTNQIK